MQVKVRDILKGRYDFSMILCEGNIMLKNGCIFFKDHLG